MTYSLLRHAYRRGARVIARPVHDGHRSRQELKTISDEMGKKYGEDYLYLGYKPYPAIVINAMGLDFRTPFPKDGVEKKPLDEFPIMKGIRNYKSLKFVMTVNATSGVDFWLQYGREPYQFPRVRGRRGHGDHYYSAPDKQIRDDQGHEGGSRVRGSMG